MTDNRTDIEIPEGMHIEQTGPEKPGEQADGSYRKTERDKLIDEMVLKANKERAKEIAYGRELAGEPPLEEEGGEAVPEGVEQTATPEEVQQSAQAEPVADKAPEPVTTAPLAPQVQPAKRKFTVNGRDLELTEDEITRAVQLGLSSQERFQEAARLRQEAEALRTQTPVTPQVTAVSQAQPTPQAAPTQPMLDDQRAREFARKLAYGNEDDQAKALRDLGDVFMQAATGRQAQAPNPMQIANAAAELAQARVVHAANVDRIGSEFSDIFQDTGLSQLAGLKVHELAQKYQALQMPVSQYQLMKEACDEVRTKYLKPVQPQPAATPQPAVAQDKLDRKRAAPRQPAAANAKAAMPQAPSAPSGSSIVNMMRKQRGQQLYN